MGVYIKGFPLPNNCGACPLRLAWCRERIYMVTRPERCPLVPVPPHRDLIDRDETMNAILEERGEDTSCWFAEIVNDMPTIIPAEEGE